MNNPGRLYYKCKVCAYFAWPTEDVIIKGGEEVESGGAGREIEANRTAASDLVNIKETLNVMFIYMKVVLKMAVILYFILIVLVLSK
ncbi:hypothetical protein BVRB_7g166370 [Beta vulgaris subsp. vulgaris]|nr:hypothetical protein BVRB_7g166370 [Beta vulgaris subsp. vulgaris]